MVLSTIFTILGAIGMVTACLRAFAGQEEIAHHNTMEAIGFWILAVLVR